MGLFSGVLWCDVMMRRWLFYLGRWWDGGKAELRVGENESGVVCGSGVMYCRFKRRIARSGGVRLMDWLYCSCWLPVNEIIYTFWSWANFRYSFWCQCSIRNLLYDHCFLAIESPWFGIYVTWLLNILPREKGKIAWRNNRKGTTTTKYI
jgi:hypothetical protein